MPHRWRLVQRWGEDRASAAVTSRTRVTRPVGGLTSTPTRAEGGTDMACNRAGSRHPWAYVRHPAPPLAARPPVRGPWRAPAHPRCGHISALPTSHAPWLASASASAFPPPATPLPARGGRCRCSRGGREPIVGSSGWGIARLARIIGGGRVDVAPTLLRQRSPILPPPSSPRVIWAR
jgi:hypothetical protein